MATKQRAISRRRNRPLPARQKANLNRLLAALPARDYDRVMMAADIVPLKVKVVLHRPGESIDHVYFPGGGFCSEVSVLQDGTMVEVATIGREGMVGLAAVIDGGPVPSVTIVLAETDICYRMSAEAFRREMNRRGRFYELVTHYGLALVGTIMQATACHAVHSVKQRLARWLLLAQDRVRKADFPMTQEFVAMMLGASRPTVTVVAQTLQKAGLITYRHGRVTIVDRKGLEKVSCECYRAVTSLLRNVTARNHANDAG